MRVHFRPYAEILHLASPIIGIQFAQVALTSTDLLMMGFLGVQQVAAGGLALLLYNQLRTMCVGMVTGVGNMIAATIGHNEKQSGSTDLAPQTKEMVQNLLRTAMLMASLTATIAALLLISLGMGLNLLGQNDDIATLARPMMLTLAPGLIPMLWFNVLRQFAVGMRRAGSLMMVTLISIIINAVLNLIFIFGLIGMPKLGLAGIGLATSLVQLASFLIYLCIIYRDKQSRPLLALNPQGAKRNLFIKIVKVGVPIALTYGSEAAVTSIASVLIGTFGALALAASNIVNQLAYIVYQFNIGLSQGSSILISRNFAKGDMDELGAVAKRSFMISFSLMTLIALIYILIPWAVLRPFFNPKQNPALFIFASNLLWFAIAHQFLKGWQNICIGLLRGIGNTRAGLTNTIIGYWLIGIPIMFLSTYLTTWESYGIWGSLCLGFGVTSLLLWWQFSRALQELQTASNPISSFI